MADPVGQLEDETWKKECDVSTIAASTASEPENLHTATTGESCGELCNKEDEVKSNSPQTHSHSSDVADNPTDPKKARQSDIDAEKYFMAAAKIDATVVLREKFNYEFSDDGKLRNTIDGKPFVFDYYDGNHSENQRRYEELGKVVDEYIFQQLESVCGLNKIVIPLPHTQMDESSLKVEPATFVFASPTLEKSDKLLVLIHGSGVVRAGQWSRRLIINHSLESGSQIPYIIQAHAEDYAVLVLNTNDNYDEKGNPIKHSGFPYEHGMYVWEHIVQKCSANHIAIVAHSAGGAVTTALMKAFKQDFQERVFAIAFTDSVHSPVSREFSEYFKKTAQNWVSSNLPLNEKLTGVCHPSSHDCTLVSAGTITHEETSWKAKDEVFDFIREHLPPLETSV